MARERWFFARDNRRMGPFPRRQLVESLLALPDPRTSLVWRHGLPAWTRAAEVPEIERLLAPFARGKETEPAREPVSPAVADASGRFDVRPAGRPGVRPKTPVKRRPGPGPLVYGGIGLAVVVVALLVWLLWPASRGNESGTSTADPGAGAPPSAFPPPDRAPDSTGAGHAGFAGWADQEADLPPSELKRLRGVAGWSGDTLTITVNNGSTWRVTEILVRTSRLKNQSIDAETAKRLLPAGDLRKGIAPDRKAGLNPLDTGPFEGIVGTQPAAYSWSIEGARGYPARSAP